MIFADTDSVCLFTTYTAQQILINHLLASIIILKPQGGYLAQSFSFDAHLQDKHYLLKRSN